MAKTKTTKPGYFVGVDVGGTKILAALVDETGKITLRNKKKTRADRGGEQVLGRIYAAIDELIAQSGCFPHDIKAIGLGVPGPLDPRTGVIAVAPNLGWRNMPLKSLLEEKYSRPTFVDNDVNVGTWAEYKLGSGVGAQYLIGMFIGTGIGGGLVFDGKMFYGKSHGAGELGHIVLREKGPKCACGNKGCFEALASRTAIARDIEKELKKGKKSVLVTKGVEAAVDMKSRVLAEAYSSGDPLTRKIMDRAARYIGLSIAGLTNLLSPDVVVLGGGLVEAMQASYLDKIRAVVKKHAFAPSYKALKIRPAMLGDDAGVLGAALIALEGLKNARA
ncbi:MAG: ROK family protein [bacterium]